MTTPHQSPAMRRSETVEALALRWVRGPRCIQHEHGQEDDHHRPADPAGLTGPFEQCTLSSLAPDRSSSSMKLPLAALIAK